MYTYTVNNLNTIEVFVEGQVEPTLRQPHYPNQDPFETKAEAEDWAQLYISSIVDEDALYAPIGKGIAGEAKPTPEQIAEFKAARELRENPSSE
jgi:hypothetical protein